MKKIILILIFCAFGNFQLNINSQTPLIDSLENELKKAKDDHLKIVLYTKLGKEYLYDDISKLRKCIKELEILSIKTQNQSGVRAANSLLANYHYFKGNYALALEYFQKDIPYYNKVKDYAALGNTYLSLGNIYDSKGDFEKAIYYYLKSLKIDEKLGDKQKLSDDYTNIGIFYKHGNKYNKALVYFKKALKIDLELKNDQFIIGTYINLGSVYFSIGDLSNSLKYSLKAYQKSVEINDLDKKAKVANNLGELFFESGDLPKSMKYHLESAKIKEQLEQKEGLTCSYLNLGKVYEKLQKNDLALLNYKRSYELSKSIDRLEGIFEASLALSKFYEKINKPEIALNYHKEYTLIKDSVFNLNSEEKITEMSTKYESEKKENQILLLRKDKKVHQIETKKQQIVIFSTIGGLITVLIFLVIIYKRFKITKKQKQIIEIQKDEVEKQKALSDELLLNILPSEIAEELKLKGKADAQLIDHVTVLFTDFKGFTQLSEKLSPQELVAEIHECFSAFDLIMQNRGVEKIKTIGDAYMAVGGLPSSNSTHANDVVLAALDIQKFMLDHKKQKEAKGELFFEIRIGVHSGPVVAGIVGVKKFAYDIWGDTVNTASRMESSGEVGKVNISGTTYELIKDSFSFIHRGKIQAKGKGDLDMYFVEK